ncbi:MAG: hypothetical protein WCP86_02195, partial [bacterium]
LCGVVEGKKFRWSRRSKDDALRLFALSLKTLGIRDSPERILERFCACDFPGKFLLEAEKRALAKADKTSSAKSPRRKSNGGTSRR